MPPPDSGCSDPDGFLLERDMFQVYEAMRGVAPGGVYSYESFRGLTRAGEPELARMLASSAGGGVRQGHLDALLHAISLGARLYGIPASRLRSPGLFAVAEGALVTLRRALLFSALVRERLGAGPGGGPLAPEFIRLSGVLLRVAAAAFAGAGRYDVLVVG